MSLELVETKQVGFTEIRTYKDPNVPGGTISIPRSVQTWAYIDANNLSVLNPTGLNKDSEQRIVSQALRKQPLLPKEIVVLNTDQAPVQSLEANVFNLSMRVVMLTEALEIATKRIEQLEPKPE